MSSWVLVSKRQDKKRINLYRRVTMDLLIDIKQEGNKSIGNLSGEIDVYTAPKLREAIIPLTEDKNNMIEIFFDNVNYMDSTGLGVFIGALKSSKENNSTLKLINLQERVLRLFEITGLNEIIDINSTIGGKNGHGSI